MSSRSKSRLKREEERLFNLLPAVYRQKEPLPAVCRQDGLQQGEPLRALMAIMEEQMKAIESDIEGLYENWFIETCQEWVLPYIGDLLGMRPMRLDGSGAFSQRAHVANTQGYRRRKGTTYVLEQAAKDASGWPARAREYLPLLATTQNINHIRHACPATLDLRDAGKLELLGGPFDDATHIAEVGNISNGHSRYNIKNIGLFFWRINSYAVSEGDACQSKKACSNCYYFSPLGIDMPLYNRPHTEQDLIHLVEEINVPARLRKRPLCDEIERLRCPPTENNLQSIYFGEDPAFRITLDGQQVRPEEMVICSLEDWEAVGWQPPDYCEDSRQESSKKSSDEYSKVRPPERKVAVDPELGRLMLLNGALRTDSEPGPKVLVSYSYGFVGEIGAGSYNRIDDLSKWMDLPGWQRLRNDEIKPQNRIFVYEVSRDKMSLADALSAWTEDTGGEKDTIGIIVISDNSSLETGNQESRGRAEEDGRRAISIVMPEESKLAIVAAAWPEFADGERLIDGLEPDGLIPHLKADLQISGNASSELILDGLLIEGKVEVISRIGRLRLSDCTLDANRGGLYVCENAHGSSIEMYSSICGTIEMDDRCKFSRLEICDSIIDGREAAAISAQAADVSIRASTVLGKTAALALQANDSIFTEMVEVKRPQAGCIRFSYLPADSSGDGSGHLDLITMRRYRCQPDEAIKKAGTPEEKLAAKKRVVPSFTSTCFGHPGFCQLSPGTPVEIRSGSEDESEMGAFSRIMQPQREADLQECLEEYLPFGLNAGIIYVD